VELVRFKLPSGRPFVIAPLSDIQWNGNAGEIWGDGLKRHIDRALQANAYFIGLGDLTDFASPSSRAKLRACGAYEGPMAKLDDIGAQLIEEVYTKFLKPTRGRWVGLHAGHHLWEFADGTTTETRLAEMLGGVHLGTEAIVQWDWAGASFQTWSHHGYGAGEEAALLTRLKKVAADFDDVAAFFMGHCTKLATSYVPKLAVAFKGQRGELIERRVALVGSGGWSKGKVVSSRHGRVPQGNYVELAGMRPISLGAPLVYVTRGADGAIELEVRNR
jgi:hypothetical protein